VIGAGAVVAVGQVVPVFFAGLDLLILIHVEPGGGGRGVLDGLLDLHLVVETGEGGVGLPKPVAEAGIISHLGGWRLLDVGLLPRCEWFVLGLDIGLGLGFRLGFRRPIGWLGGGRGNGFLLPGQRVQLGSQAIQLFVHPAVSISERHELCLQLRDL
jgi:hypothetical protein